jgi:hypothetical protein
MSVNSLVISSLCILSTLCVLRALYSVLAETCPVAANSAEPTITPGGVVNAADHTAVVAPGTIITVFGDSLASKVISANGNPLPTVLAGTSVEVKGHAIPLFFVSPKQIDAQMPFGVYGQLQVRVRTASGISTPETITVGYSDTSLFTKAYSRP